MTEFLFYQGPTSLLLITNAIFFALTVFKILKIKRETAVLKEGDSNTHSSGTNGGKEDTAVSLERLF
jgi:hypothetical protein